MRCSNLQQHLSAWAYLSMVNSNPDIWSLYPLIAEKGVVLQPNSNGVADLFLKSK